MTQISPSILVVGSANVDFIVRSERLPRPGETVVGGELITAGGGKGANQAIAAQRLGARATLVARVGNDGPGQFALEAFRAEALDISHVTTDADSATGVALILVDRAGQNLISVASGANLLLTPTDIQNARIAFDGANALICQLEVPLESVQLALAQARERGIVTILNPAPARPVPDDILRLTDWITPNEFEASTLSDIPVTDAASARRAGHLLLDRGVGGVVVTLGDRGAVLVTPDLFEVRSAHAVQAIDATAAGDAFTAAFAVAIARGESPSAALAFANAAGALTTTRRGAQPSLPTSADVARLLVGQVGADG